MRIDEPKRPHQGQVSDIGFGKDSPWTTMRLRKVYRNTLRDLGRLKPIVIGGIPEVRPMNNMLEYLVDEANAKLVHRDMGPNYTHTMDVYCGCGPQWPDTKPVVLMRDDPDDYLDDDDEGQL